MRRGIAFLGWLALTTWLVGLPWFGPRVNALLSRCDGLPWELSCGVAPPPLHSLNPNAWPEAWASAPRVSCAKRPDDPICSSGVLGNASLPAWCRFPGQGAVFNDAICPVTRQRSPGDFSLSYFISTPSATGQFAILAYVPITALLRFYVQKPSPTLLRLCGRLGLLLWSIFLCVPGQDFRDQHLVVVAMLLVVNLAAFIFKIVALRAESTSCDKCEIFLMSLSCVGTLCLVPTFFGSPFLYAVYWSEVLILVPAFALPWLDV